MKRVVHLWPFDGQPDSGFSAQAENRLFELMLSQAQAGWQVELVMIIVQDGLRLTELAESLNSQGISVTRFSFPVRGTSIFAWLLRPAILPKLTRHLKGRLDSVNHLHINVPLAFLFVLAAWRAGCVHLVAGYSSDVPKLAGSLSRWRFAWVDRVVRRTIVPDKAMRDHLVLQVGLSPSRMRIVEDGETGAMTKETLEIYEEALGIAAPSEFRRRLRSAGR